jgi:Xaa-Pro aminopeptidase
MDEKLIRARVRAVWQCIRAGKLDALILTSPENVRYVTGFQGEDSWVCIVGRKVFFLTDSRYTEQAQSECIGCKIIDNNRGMLSAVGKLLGRFKSVKIAGVEDSTSIGVMKRLRKEVSVRLKPIGGLVEPVRAIKDAGEVKQIKKAVKISWESLDYTLRHLRAGVSESEAAGLLDYQIRKRGAQIGFETIVAFGPNGSRNHHQPGARKLKKNDTILIDFGTKVAGYMSDITRSFVFGKASRLYERIYYTVLEAQQAALAKMRPGTKLLDIDTEARRVIEEKGLPVYGHGTGHGIGLVVHEQPFMSKASKGRLEAGQVVTIEPGIYLPGKFGVRIEDDVLITETGCKVISKDNRFGFSNGKMPVLRSR